LQFCQCGKPSANRQWEGFILWRVVCSREGMRDAETALGWPARAGKLVLTLALDRVATYYRSA
ncbi:MAG TPA: DUF6456 domain-containing protein, partial [Sphingomicrobium sp.]